MGDFGPPFRRRIMIDKDKKIRVDSDGKRVKDDTKKEDTKEVPQIITKEM
jgi:hypothetical protein